MVKTTPKSAPKAAKSNVASKVKAHSKATANTKKPASAISKAKDTIALKEDAEKSGKVSAGTGDLKSKRKSASDFLDEEIAPKKGKKTAAGSDESEEVHFKKPAVTGSKSTPVSSGKVTKQEGKQAQKAGEKKQLKSALKTIVTVEVESEDVEMDNIVTAKSKTVSNTKKNEKISAPATATKGKKAAATAAPKTKKKAAPVPASVIAEEAQAENSDDEDFIHGFSSSGSESEGEDDSDVEMEQDDLAAVERKRALDVKTLPTTAKDDKTVKRKLEAAKKKKDAQRGTLYLGRIPHGFYEEQMKEYFSQFGDVTRLRLARNKKVSNNMQMHLYFLLFSVYPPRITIIELTILVLPRITSSPLFLSYLCPSYSPPFFLDRSL